MDSVFTLLFEDKNIFNGQLKIAGDLESEQDRGIVAAIFQGANGLAGNLECAGQFFLFDAALAAQFFQTVFQNKAPFM